MSLREKKSSRSTKQKGWENPTLPLVRAIDRSGRTLGYLSLHDCKRFGLTPVEAVTPTRYLDDPYVTFHADMAFEQGLLRKGKDLNPVQWAMVMSVIARRERRRNERDEMMLLANMALLRPDAYEHYVRRKKVEEMEEEELGVPESDIEWRAPRNMEEFIDVLRALGEDEDSSEDRAAHGMSMSEVLPEDVIENLEDD